MFMVLCWSTDAASADAQSEVSNDNDNDVFIEGFSRRYTAALSSRWRQAEQPQALASKRVRVIEKGRAGRCLQRLHKPTLMVIFCHEMIQMCNDIRIREYIR